MKPCIVSHFGPSWPEVRRGGCPGCRSPPLLDFRSPQQNRMEAYRMAIINLRNFYPWYTWDEFVEVPDVIAGELFADRRYEKAHERKMYRYKAQYSLDVENGIETAAIVHSIDSPEAVYAIKERRCRICCALNSLPEIQGKRIEAHYIHGISQRDIARAEGVNERNIRLSISKGLAGMKKYLQNRK